MRSLYFCGNPAWPHIPQDAERSKTLSTEFEGILLDFSRQRATTETFQLLLQLANAAGLKGKMQAMAAGAHINVTEDRAVGHMALRAPASASTIIDGVNVVPAVHEVLNHIHKFSASVRSGEWKGVTGKKLTDVVSIGIGREDFFFFHGLLFLHDDAERCGTSFTMNLPVLRLSLC